VASAADIVVNPENAWRLETPGASGWAKSVRPDAADKYYMVSVDTHLSPPPTLFRERIAAEYRDRLPRLEVKDGIKYIVTEGRRPQRLFEPELEGEDLLRTRAGGSPDSYLKQLNDCEFGTIGERRIADERMDGVDGEIIFPNGPALLMWGSDDPGFVDAQARIWNDWAIETLRPHLDSCNPVAAIAPSDLDLAVAEVQRAAKLGYRVITLPSKPIWGAHDVGHVNYNLPHFDPLWAAIQDADMAITFHVSTGKDPRAARGNGGAIVNYVVHSMAPTMEPIVNLCSSGVFERFPKLRAGTIEANAGWIPWMLDSMDEAARKHHFWVRPKLKHLPSDYFHANCFASIAEDASALKLCDDYRLGDNLIWANDYPHHEGTWPHSAEAIERTFGVVSEESRAKILGLNAARIFKFDIPERYK
jgi:predicted TIM-barrel fold metal-dependent hydrolase